MHLTLTIFTLTILGRIDDRDELEGLHVERTGVIDLALSNFPVTSPESAYQDRQAIVMSHQPHTPKIIVNSQTQTSPNMVHSSRDTCSPYLSLMNTPVNSVKNSESSLSCQSSPAAPLCLCIRPGNSAIKDDNIALGTPTTQITGKSKNFQLSKSTCILPRIHHNLESVLSGDDSDIEVLAVFDHKKDIIAAQLEDSTSETEKLVF